MRKGTVYDLNKMTGNHLVLHKVLHSKFDAMSHAFFGFVCIGKLWNCIFIVILSHVVFKSCVVL